MITNLLHRLVARPRVYDLVQCLAGAKRVRRQIAREIAPLPKDLRVVDVGGGTGLARPLFDPAARYLCLDIDPVKVAGYLAKHPGAAALVADAAHMPLESASIDLVLCALVTHHLTDDQLVAFLTEAARILTPVGHLLLVDCVWKPLRLPGRLIWRYDRGSHPRTPLELRSFIESRFDVTHWRRFAVFHEYALCVATPLRARSVTERP